jgi:hypothetical protein
LTHKLLTGDERVLALFAKNPFPTSPPRFVRATVYRYRFSPFGEKAVWQREPIGSYLAPVARNDPKLLAALRAYGLLE